MTLALYYTLEGPDLFIVSVSIYEQFADLSHGYLQVVDESIRSPYNNV